MKFIKNNIIGLIVGVVISAPIAAYASNNVVSMQRIEERFNRVDNEIGMETRAMYSIVTMSQIEYKKLEDMQKQNGILRSIEKHLKEIANK